MRNSLKMAAGLLAVGAGTAVASVDAAEHGAKALTVSAALLSGACTALGVTTFFAGWVAAGHRAESEDAEV